jgi:hypothetical protein
MADFLDSRRGHSPLSDLLHVFMNAGLAIGVVGLAPITQALWPSVLLVLVAKWRVLAVRPRFWWVNLRANLVDLLVGLSVAYLAYRAGDNYLLDATLLVFYAVWLIFIKPRSSSLAQATQAGLMLLVASTALMALTFRFEPFFALTGAFVIAYAAAHHYLSSTDGHATYLSLVFGLLNAEIWWLLYHWNIYYLVPGIQLQIPQAAFFTLLLAYIAKLVVDARHQETSRSRFLAPAIFSFILLLTVLLSFSDALKY